MIARSTGLQNKQSVINVQVKLCYVTLWHKVFDFQKNVQHFCIWRAGIRQSRQGKNRKGFLENLKFPGDFSKPRQGKQAPDSVQASEKSPCAGWHHGVGFGSKTILGMVLQNHLNRVLHCRLSPTVSITINEGRLCDSIDLGEDPEKLNGT